MHSSSFTLWNTSSKCASAKGQLIDFLAADKKRRQESLAAVGQSIRVVFQCRTACKIDSCRRQIHSFRSNSCPLFPTSHLPPPPHPDSHSRGQPHVNTLTRAFINTANICPSRRGVVVDDGVGGAVGHFKVNRINNKSRQGRGSRTRT